MRRWRALTLCALTLCALVAGGVPGVPGAAVAHAGRRAAKPELKRQKDSHGGRHWRLTVPGKGAVHLWVPPGYVRGTAGIVVYLHGYWTDPDRAWREHNLPKQFRQSRQNAVFIVPASPTDRADRVTWPDLAALKATVRRAGLRLPNGHVVVVAHSGAYRTAERWVDDRTLSQVTLVDGFYGNERPWLEFIETGARAKHHKLVLIGRETHARAHAFTRKLKGRVLDRVPPTYEAIPRRHKRARLLYLKRQYGHMALVDGRGALDLFLRLSPLRRLR